MSGAGNVGDQLADTEIGQDANLAFNMLNSIAIPLYGVAGEVVGWYDQLANNGQPSQVTNALGNPIGFFYNTGIPQEVASTATTVYDAAGNVLGKVVAGAEDIATGALTTVVKYGAIALFAIFVAIEVIHALEAD